MEVPDWCWAKPCGCCGWTFWAPESTFSRAICLDEVLLFRICSTNNIEWKNADFIFFAQNGQELSGWSSGTHPRVLRDISGTLAGHQRDIWKSVLRPKVPPCRNGVHSCDFVILLLFFLHNCNFRVILSFSLHKVNPRVLQDIHGCCGTSACEVDCVCLHLSRTPEWFCGFSYMFGCMRDYLCLSAFESYTMRDFGPTLIFCFTHAELLRSSLPCNCCDVFGNPRCSRGTARHTAVLHVHLLLFRCRWCYAAESSLSRYIGASIATLTGRSSDIGIYIYIC